MNEKEKILSVNNLRISFRSDHGIVHAVRGVSFDLYKGETLCIVGESGSGKSVTSKTIMGILPASSIIEEGSIFFEGEDLTQVSEEEFHRIRGNKIGMIFQDPLSSLNPIMRVGKQITEAMLINKDMLKRRYDNLISKENTAYKNAVSMRKNNIEKEKNSLIFFKEDMKKRIQDLEYQSKDKENTEEIDIKAEKIKAKEEYAKKKAEAKARIAKINAEFKEVAPSLKEALKNKKKEAKAEVKEYHLSLIKKRDEALKELEGKKANIPAEQYETEKKKINDDYIAKTRITKAMAKEAALEVMKEVGISEPERRFKQYPFEFSGGMRQRIVIAIALTANPEVLICDEPTTALDVTIQAQILELINKLKKERNMSIIFITHDLGVVANMADRVAVMYAGKIVEVGTAEEVFFKPAHPYTWALLSSIPDIDSKEKLEAIPGTPPNLINPPKGDAFAARNKYALKIDFLYEPPEFQISETHKASTWLLYEKYAPKTTLPKIVEERIKNALEEERKYEQEKQNV